MLVKNLQSLNWSLEAGDFSRQSQNQNKTQRVLWWLAFG